jgi:probable HAF family extracellular repeat protein
MNELHIEILAANEHGTIVGELRRPIDGPPRAFLWRPEQAIVDLGTLGGLMSKANDVNYANSVVGTAGTEDNRWSAFLWRENRPILNLGTLDANNSIAEAINDLGIVVGYIYDSPSRTHMEYHRAFLWSESDGLKLVPEIDGYWARAMDINNQGEILGWFHGQHQMCSFVWSRSGGLISIEGEPGRPFYASSVNDFGEVVGEADDEHGVRRAMIWSRVKGLRVLPVPFSFHPMSIDNRSNIIGADSKRPWSSAWLLRPNGSLIRLPAGRDHSVDARVINGAGIFGHARGNDWKHVHPIRWSLGQD